MATLIACGAIVAVATSASADPPPTRRISTVETVDPWAAHIAEAAKRFAIPERWIRAVMAVESSGDRTARSPKGAIGLMQVMPATWRELRSRHGLGNDPWQPRDNILAGGAYLREMHDRYGSIAAMLAAYNAGPKRYDAHLANGRALPDETVDYVAKIAPMIDGKVPVMRLAGIASRTSWSRDRSSSDDLAFIPATVPRPPILLPADHRAHLRSSICRRSCRRPMASSCEGRTPMEASDEHRASTLRGVRNRRMCREPRVPPGNNRRKAR
jgi:hypothetical protein